MEGCLFVEISIKNSKRISIIETERERERIENIIIEKKLLSAEYGGIFNIWYTLLSYWFFFILYLSKKIISNLYINWNENLVKEKFQ